jgi:CPA2 family monovalent cation:H+ antiporter-2
MRNTGGRPPWVNHPHVYIVARAIDRRHVYDLYAAGCRDIIRETFDGGVRAGRSALEALGMHPFEAELKARQFVDQDKRAVAALAELYDPTLPLHENSAYVERSKQIRAENEAIMQGRDTAFTARPDRAWSPPSLDDVEAETGRGVAG